MAFEVQELEAKDLRWTCDPDLFSMKSTEELTALEEVIGQDRAVRALSFGIDIGSPGYHIYAMGPEGTGKTKTIHKFLKRASTSQEVPDDWAYINNFDDTDKPRALRMPAGTGRELKDDIEKLVESLQEEVPGVFDGEEYRHEQEQLEDDIQERVQALFNDLRDKAEAHGMTLIQTPQGIVVTPLIEGEPATPDRVDDLDEETRQRFESNRDELQNEMRDTMRQVRRLQDEGRERVRDLDRQVVGFAVGHRIDSLKEKYEDHAAIVDFLDEIRHDILDKVQDIKRQIQMEQSQQEAALLMQARGSGENPYERYHVNLIVDNSETDGAPVVLERNAHYHNLIGRVEHRAQFGALMTDYTMIKAGALHRANGGYLMIQARDILAQPFAWQALTRTLKNSEVVIEPMGESFQTISTRTLEPEPIPLDVKVIVIGNPTIYYLLYQLDEDFQELFKVKADFGRRTDRGDAVLEKYARFIGQTCREENLRHFDPTGVARIIERAARIVSDQEKLATTFGDIVDFIRQSSYWAGQNGHDLVTGEDVQRAVDEHVYRANRVEERIQEQIEDGNILINTEGKVIGQVNGISILPMGDYAFGKPSRITARTYAGNAGVINIERETELGGSIHNKGVLILAGYLGGKYATDRPLTLSASLTFEQQYQGVDGDSASSAELYALLSALSGFAIDQELAVTGSVNQRGEIQAIGGVNEKIEGFFDVCRIKGLTGNQGVLIPSSNVRHLMLRRDVVDAVREGQFHIFPISTVDEGIALLTGIAVGALQDDGTYPDDTLNHAIMERLGSYAEGLRHVLSNGRTPQHMS
ncbi:MAG: Lon protease family protein [Chloroflexota bacterium]